MNKLYTIIAILLGVFSISSCTSGFEAQNTNEAGFPSEKQGYDYQDNLIPIQIIEQGIYFNYDFGSGKNWPFQIMQDLSADMFSGYFHDFNGSFNKNNSTYNLNDGWTSSNWIYTYGYIMTAVQKSEKINTAEKYPAFAGITKILKVELMHRIADQYGPIVYTKFGSSTGSAPDTQKDAYYQFFEDLNTGISLIRSFMEKNPGKETFASADILMPEGKRTYSEWIKFANSLRLRLAMRISNVDPAKAKTEAQKSFSDAGGFLEDATEVVAVSTASGYTNPLGEINKSWSEVYMNASMESYLTGYNDPRISKYFDKTISKNDPTKYGNNIINYFNSYKGIRQGTGTEHNFYAGHSRSTVSQTTNAILMTAAEVWFLRAEAALKGYVAGNAGALYQKGVQASFTQWGAGDATAYLNSDATPADYKDAFDATFNSAAQSTITPKWDSAATNEQKLERIITQKWLACYPEGCEAWTEQRRTGYPKLFKVVVNNSKGTIDTNTMIRRIFFPQSLKNDNPTQYSQLVTALGGDDTGGTRLWWDTGSNKF